MSPGFRPALAATRARPGSSSGALQLDRELEPVERVVPHALEPRPEASDRGPPRRVEAMAAVPPNAHQPRPLEVPEVLRHRAERDVPQAAVDLARTAFGAPYQPQDLAAARGRERVQDRKHGRQFSKY